MAFKIVLESNEVDIGETELFHINKVDGNYLCFFKEVKFYDGYDHSYLKKDHFLNIKKGNGDTYLTSVYIIDVASFSYETNMVAIASSDYNVSCNYINFYSEMVFSWNRNDGAYSNWIDLSNEKKKIWLDLSFDWHGLQKKYIENDIIIDCSSITDIPSLYCCLGESFLGGRGYLGRNLDALDDCLIDITHKNIKVIFNNSIQMLNSLNTEKNRKKYQEDYVSIIVDILKQHGFVVELR
ncbi:barstar family protein [Xenorhabdus sp. XENO-1]|uniref:barstar family protein n=1 Tax=Xenorhabdus bovienii TaxID=40576 RepID=UPI0020CA5411|nr:barstar family protein [Xenorhabdus bovienii]MCP9266884.1 barstar family protein [Xenorhabdus bovienii subsp. africana]